MKITTAISTTTDNDTIIRGEPLSELARSRPFTDAVFLLLAKRLPSAEESTLLSTVMTLSIDHGAATASSLATRIVQSTGNELNAAVAAGVLALGKYHGSAVEHTMRQFLCMQEGEGAVQERASAFVASALAERRIISGYGHKVFKDADPRVQQMLALCKELDYSSEFLDLALAVEEEIATQKGKRLVLNIDGLLAALLCAFGIAPEAGNGAFIAARVPGLIAQAIEEREREKPVRRLDDADISYDG